MVDYVGDARVAKLPDVASTYPTVNVYNNPKRRNYRTRRVYQARLYGNPASAGVDTYTYPLFIANRDLDLDAVYVVFPNTSAWDVVNREQYDIIDGTATVIFRRELTGQHIANELWEIPPHIEDRTIDAGESIHLYVEASNAGGRPLPAGTLIFVVCSYD